MRLASGRVELRTNQGDRGLAAWQIKGFGVRVGELEVCIFARRRRPHAHREDSTWLSSAAAPPAAMPRSSLQKLGIRPLIICKGLVGKSGASLFAGNLVISGRAARQYRRQRAQHRRVSHQVPQPISHRSALGAALRRMDGEDLLSGARGSRSVFSPRRRRATW